MTTLIHQPTPNSCGLACLAMAVGRDYDEMWSTEIGRAIAERAEKEQTLTGDNLEAAYEYAGFAKDVTRWAHYCEFDKPESTRRMLMGRRAFLTVVSLNTEKGQHMVYWDGHTLWDPSPLQTYKWLRKCFPIWVTIVV